MGYSHSFAPNPKRRHTRGRRGRGTEGITDLQAAFEEDKQANDRSAARIVGLDRERQKAARSEEKRYGYRGLEQRKGRNTQRKALDHDEKIVLARRNRAKAGIGGVSKAYAHQRREVMGDAPGQLRDVRPKRLPWTKKPSRKAPAGTRGRDKPRALDAAQVKAFVGRYRRVGDLPDWDAASIQAVEVSGAGIDGKALGRMIRAMLVRGNVERNPGPGDHLGVKDSRRPQGAKRATKPLRITRPGAPEVEAKAPKVRAGFAGAALHELEAQIQVEIQKEAGAVDAHAEAEAEAVRLKLAKEDTRTDSITAFINEDVQRFVGTAFNPIIMDEPLKQMADAQPHEKNMIAFPVPHKVTIIREIRVVDAQARDEEGRLGSRVAQLEGEEKLMTWRKMQRILLIRVVHISYGFLMREASREEDSTTYSISWEQFQTFKQARLGTYAFAAVVERVQTFRARNRLFLQNSLYDESNGPMNDNIFAALVVSPARRMAQGVDLWSQMAAQQALKLCMRREIMGDGGVKAGGTYVVGYDVTFADLFPEAMAEAVRLAKAGDARAAVSGLADRVMQQGAHITGKIEDLAAVFKEKGDRYCRQASVFLEGIIPAFPNPAKPANALAGVVKRLLRPSGQMTEDAQKRELAVMAFLISLGQKAGVSDNRETVLEFVNDHVDGHLQKQSGWSDAQKACFKQGAVDAAGPITAEFKKMVAESIAHFKCFIKAESYEPDERKAPRNIVCPGHYLRGVLWAAYASPLERFFSLMGDRAVKHHTPEENAKITRDTLCDVEGGDQVFLELDGKSFESLINKFRRRCETSVVAAFAHPEASEMVSFIGALFAERWEVTQGIFTATLESIRRSGEYGTSGCNFIGNFGILMGASSAAAGVAVEKVTAWTETAFSEMRFRLEGDDGIVRVCQSWVERKGKQISDLEKAFLAAGVEMSMKVSRSFEDTGFIGQTLVEVRKGTELVPLVYKDPLKLIANLTHWIDCDPASHAKDEIMLVARAMSYELMYGHLPLVGHACWGVLTAHQDTVAELRKAATEEIMGDSKVGPYRLYGRAALHLRASFWKARGLYGCKNAIPVDFKFPHSDAITGKFLPLDRACVVSEATELLEQVQRDLNATPETIRAWGRQIAESFAAGKALRIEELATHYASLKGVAGMTILKVTDTRDKARAQAEAIISTTAVRVAARASDAFALVSAAVAAALTVAAGWATVLIQSWILTLVGGGVQTLSVFCFSFLGAAGLFGVLIFPLVLAATLFMLWLVLGVCLQWPMKMIRNLITIASYTFICATFLGAVRVYQGAAAAARMDITGGLGRTIRDRAVLVAAWFKSAGFVTAITRLTNAAADRLEPSESPARSSAASAAISGAVRGLIARK